MTFSLHTLPKRLGRRHKRVGRGHGSGRGTYAGRGIKGQRARKGGRRGMIRRSLKHIVARLPKQRGFTSRTPKYMTVSLAMLEKHFANGDHVTPATLTQKGMAMLGYRGVKVLASGTLTKKLTVTAHAFSATAVQAIEKAGGSIRRLRP